MSNVLVIPGVRMTPTTRTRSPSTAWSKSAIVTVRGAAVGLAPGSDVPVAPVRVGRLDPADVVEIDAAAVALLDDPGERDEVAVAARASRPPSSSRRSLDEYVVGRSAIVFGAGGLASLTRTQAVRSSLELATSSRLTG